MKRFFKFLGSLFKKVPETEEAKKNDAKLKTIVCLVLAAGSLILTIVNIFGVFRLTRGTFEFSQANRMLMSTVILTVLFLISAFIVGVFRARKVAMVLVSLSIMAIFSFYAMIGGNDGFAVLWIIIVPVVSMLLLTYRLGFIVSVYFLVFVFVVFYTPSIITYIKDTYNPGLYNSAEFVRRFPLLYLVSFAVGMVISGQKIYYANKSEMNSLFDPMTTLKNRRFFMDYLTNAQTKGIKNNLVVVSIDLNGLKNFNDTYGHIYGDNAIEATGKVMKEVYSKYTDNLFRTGGDEFFAFFEDNQNKADELIEQLRGCCEETLIKDEKLSLSIGMAKSSDYPDMNIDFLISVAERAMYKDKEEFYRNTRGERRRAV